MHAFDYFYTVVHQYKHMIDKKETYREECNADMLAFYKTAKCSIDMFSGELHPFAADLDFANGFIEFLKDNPHIDFRVVCGDYIACRKDEETGELFNPLLRAIENNIIGGTVYCNYLDVMSQISQKYFHSSIIDLDSLDSSIMLEIPHDYDAHIDDEKNKKIFRFYMSSCKEAADKLLKMYKRYIAYNELETVSDFKTAEWTKCYYTKLKGKLDAMQFASMYSNDFIHDLVG